MKNTPEPLYQHIRDVFKYGFKIDWTTAIFIASTHLIFLTATPLAYYYAPDGFWKVMLAWTLIHALAGSLSTTVYSHRLIAHEAASHISWPVHLLFGFVGQVLAVQGHTRRWSAMHVMHHSVDRTGKHHLDPYSATWFSSGWRNFLWSHMLTFFFHHPNKKEENRAYEAKSATPLLMQEKFYVPLLVLWNFLLPLMVGSLLTGTLFGGVCLMVAAIGGFILAQHNTWTVNSVTHMWGLRKGAFSSAKNNYIWLGPLGEGNHHADHHDYPRDYRNGFGWSGWLLDPSRYIILLLSGLGLVKGLRRASKSREAEIIALQKLAEVQSRTQNSRWESWETRLEKLKADWLEATRQWESFKSRKIQLEAMALPRLELKMRLQQLKREMEVAKRSMKARKTDFFNAIYELTVMQQARVL